MEGRNNLPRLLHNRQSKVNITFDLDSCQPSCVKGCAVKDEFAQRCSMTPDLVRRLGLFQELHGHTGCVNCIQVFVIFFIFQLFWNISLHFLPILEYFPSLFTYFGMLLSLTVLSTSSEGQNVACCHTQNSGMHYK